MMATRLLKYFPAVVILVLSTEPVSAIVIDDFSVGPITVERTGVDPGVAEQLGLDPTHVIGGARVIEVGRDGTPPQTLTVDAGAGQLVFETGDSTDNTAGYFDIAYGSLASPLNVDLTAEGSNALILDYEIEPTNVFLSGGLLVRSVGTSLEGAGFGNFDQIRLPNGTTRLILPFDRYRGIDFENVTEIVLTLNRFRSSSKITFYGIETIPEPTCLLLLATSLSIMQCRRRSRN